MARRAHGGASGWGRTQSLAGVSLAGRIEIDQSLSIETEIEMEIEMEMKVLELSLSLSLSLSLFVFEHRERSLCFCLFRVVGKELPLFNRGRPTP